MGHFIYNGKTYKEGAAIIGADNRGLRYGDGIFETMKLLDGRLVLGDEHFARLWRGMNVLGFDIPKYFSPEQLTEEVITLAGKNQHSPARVRLQIIRGDGGLYDAASNHPNYIIQTSALTASSGEWNSNGLVAGIYNAVKKSCDVLSNLKHNNYLPYAMAALHAKKEKWNDALLLNVHGRVCDSTIANVFIVKDGQVYTPALTEGCVAGIVREYLIKTLRQTEWEVTETALTIEDVLNADEVFLTNSMYTIRWVQGIEKASYQNTITRKIYPIVENV